MTGGRGAVEVAVSAPTILTFCRGSRVGCIFIVFAGDTPAATVQFELAGDTRSLGSGGRRKSTEGNEGNERLCAEDPNSIFVFFVAFCNNLLCDARLPQRRDKKINRRKRR
jgi:hypothetical protein